MLMLLNVLLFTLFGGKLPLIQGRKVLKEDPQQKYYCGIVCRNNYETVSEKHVACYCNDRKHPPTCQPHAQTPKDIIAFRKTMLEHHNTLRNYIASGREHNKNVGEASNMNAVNYDLELEYVAMCTAMKCDETRDFCRKTKEFNDVRQNIFTVITIDDLGYEKYTDEAVKKWYHEFRNIPDFAIDDFWYSEHWSSFAAMMWWSVTHIGCAITSGNAEMPVEKQFDSDDETETRNKTFSTHKSWPRKIVITCNYGLINQDLSNEKTIPVYKRGLPTTQCFGDRKANTGKFHALCGEVQEVPTGMNLVHPAYKPPEYIDAASRLYNFNFIAMNVVFVIALNHI